MEKKLVSIIMPVYNADKYLKKAVESILMQTYQDLELLICDDASTDKTYNLLQSYLARDNRIKLFRNANNKKQIATRNFLIAQAKGELVAFQDADDWSSLHRIEKQVKEFGANPALGMCGTFAQYYDDAGKTQTRRKTPETNDLAIKESITKGNQFCGASIMVKRDILFSIGMYRDYFTGIGNEDYDLTSRIVERYHSKNLSEFLYCVRQSASSSSRNVLTDRQLISADLVKAFIKQRVEGSDSLDLNDLETLTRIETKLLEPFQKDKSLVYRRSADVNWYCGDRLNYMKSSLNAIMQDPFKLINWKYLMVACYRIVTLSV